MPGSTTKHDLPYSLGSDLASTIDDTMQDLAEVLNGIIAVDDQGALGSRPTSSPGSPGKEGRYYWATDTSQLFRDHGTGWTEIRVGSTAPPQSPETNLKIIRGAINGVGGAAMEGSGFSSTESGAGFWPITFTVPFSDAPSVTITPIGLAGKLALDALPTVNGFTVVSDGSAVDRSFCFEAIGPA